MTASDPSLRRLSYPLKPRPFSEPSDFYLLPLSTISTSGTGSAEKIWGLRYDGHVVTEQMLLADSNLNITSFGEDREVKSIGV